MIALINWQLRGIEFFWDRPQGLCTLGIEIGPWEKARVTFKLPRGVAPLVRCGGRGCEWSDFSGADR